MIGAFRIFQGVLFGVLISSASLAAPLVGYGSSDAVLSAKTQEVFYLGFELGMAIAMKKKDVSDWIVTEHSWDGSPMGASRSAQNLVRKGVVAVVGYPISQDALLASKEVLKANLMGIFAAARHSDLSTLGPNIVSTVPSMKQDVSDFLNLIQSKFPRKTGVLISNPYNVFCKNQEDLVVEALKNISRFSNIKMSVIRLSKDLKLSGEDLGRLKSGGVDYIWMSTYPDMSIGVLRQMKENAIDLPLVANASWTTDDFELIRRLLINRRMPVYSASIWIQGSESAKIFEDGFRRRFGREPSTESAYGFDLGIIVGQTFLHAKKPVTAGSFKEAFYRNPCFKGTVSAQVCFLPRGGHAIRPISFVQFTNGAFHLLSK